MQIIIIITLSSVTTVPKGSTILPGNLTPAKILTGYRGVSTAISHMAWAGSLGHGPIQLNYFLTQPCGRTNTKK